MEFHQRIRIVMFALVLLLSVGAAGSSGTAGDFVQEEQSECSAVKTAWSNHGLGAHIVPNSPLPGL